MVTNGSIPSQQGALRTVIAAPAAPGADASITIPASTRWRLLSATVVFSTDATVANRTVTVSASSASSSTAGTRSTPTTAGTAAEVSVFSFGQPVAQFVVGGAFYAPAPTPILLPAAATIGTGIANIQAGDQVDQFSVYVEEWIDP